MMQPSPNAATVLGTGINVQDILSQGVAPNFQNLSDSQLSNKLRALVFKSAVWGVPVGVFFHVNELSSHQVGVMLDALKSAGATLMSNSQLVNYLVGAQQNAGHHVLRGLEFGRARGLAPRTDIASWWTRARALGAEYKYDLMGIDQTQFGSGWEIGAQAFVPEYTGHIRIAP